MEVVGVIRGAASLRPSDARRKADVDAKRPVRMSLSVVMRFLRFVRANERWARHWVQQKLRDESGNFSNRRDAIETRGGIVGLDCQADEV